MGKQKNGGIPLKIDLHCHTKQIKSGDGEGRNVTPELFREKVMNADVKIVAITNHNTLPVFHIILAVD